MNCPERLVSRRMQDVQMPIIPWVGDLIRRTPGTISLGQASVDYAPPAAAHEALIRFGSEPARHKYQHELGIPELRERIAARLNAENGIDVDRFSLMVTAGGNMALPDRAARHLRPGGRGRARQAPISSTTRWRCGSSAAGRWWSQRTSATSSISLRSRRPSDRAPAPWSPSRQQSERGGVSGIRSARGERTVRGPGLVPHQRRGL